LVRYEGVNVDESLDVQIARCRMVMTAPP